MRWRNILAGLSESHCIWLLLAMVGLALANTIVRHSFCRPDRVEFIAVSDDMRQVYSFAYGPAEWQYQVAGTDPLFTWVGIASFGGPDHRLRTMRGWYQSTWAASYWEAISSDGRWAVTCHRDPFSQARQLRVIDLKSGRVRAVRAASAAFAEPETYGRFFDMWIENPEMRVVLQTYYYGGIQPVTRAFRIPDLLPESAPRQDSQVDFWTCDRKTLLRHRVFTFSQGDPRPLDKSYAVSDVSSSGRYVRLEGGPNVAYMVDRDTRQIVDISRLVDRTTGLVRTYFSFELYGFTGNGEQYLCVTEPRSPDASSSRLIEVWDLAVRRRVVQFELECESPRWLLTSPGGKVLAARCDDGVLFFDLLNGKKLDTVSEKEIIERIGRRMDRNQFWLIVGTLVWLGACGGHATWRRTRWDSLVAALCGIAMATPWAFLWYAHEFMRSPLTVPAATLVPLVLLKSLVLLGVAVVGGWTIWGNGRMGWRSMWLPLLLTPWLLAPLGIDLAGPRTPPASFLLEPLGTALVAMLVGGGVLAVTKPLRSRSAWTTDAVSRQTRLTDLLGLLLTTGVAIVILRSHYQPYWPLAVTRESLTVVGVLGGVTGLGAAAIILACGHAHRSSRRFGPGRGAAALARVAVALVAAGAIVASVFMVDPGVRMLPLPHFRLWGQVLPCWVALTVMVAMPACANPRHSATEHR